MQEEGPQPFGHGEHELAVGDGVQEFVLEPFTPNREPLGMARRAQVARLATECDEEFGATRVATDACKPTF